MIDQWFPAKLGRVIEPTGRMSLILFVVVEDMNHIDERSAESGLILRRQLTRVGGGSYAITSSARDSSIGGTLWHVRSSD
jgi:hypothetical protein